MTTRELDRTEFTAGYLAEADEHVRGAISNLLAVETALRSGAPQHRLVRELFRSLHTLKGLSAMVGIDPIVDLAHEMEAILRDADRSAGSLSAEAVELLLKGVRTIEQRVGAFAKKKPVAAAPRKLLEALGKNTGCLDAGARASSCETRVPPSAVHTSASSMHRLDTGHGECAQTWPLETTRAADQLWPCAVGSSKPVGALDSTARPS
jgi:chemotaxis protein histidine kinase CheA